MLVSAALIGKNYQPVRSLLDSNWLRENHAAPEEQLDKNEQQGLSVIKEITSQILKDGSTITIGVAKDGSDFCKLYGSKANAHLLFNRRVLQSLSGKITLLTKLSKNTWEQMVHSLPDEPDQLILAIKKKKEDELGILIGLHDESKYNLSKDELYFVLCHEILGHYQNHDNEKLVRTKLIVTLISLVVIGIFGNSLPNSTPFFIFYFMLSLFFTALASSKVEFYNECNADCAGFHDKPAKQGAKTFFKKMLVAETAQKRYYELKGIEGNKLENWKKEYHFGHPSAESRYRSLLKVTQNQDLK